MPTVDGGIAAAVMMSGACGTSVGAAQGGAKVVWAANHAPWCIDLHDANEALWPDCEAVCRCRFKRPAPRETFRLMAFPEDFVIPPHIRAKRTKAYAMAGDAVSPPVMRAIVEHIQRVA